MYKSQSIKKIKVQILKIFNGGWSHQIKNGSDGIWTYSSPLLETRYAILLGFLFVFVIRPVRKLEEWTAVLDTKTVLSVAFFLRVNLL
jgi:hypothetical protein